jgi:hypothetical protein
MVLEDNNMDLKMDNLDNTWMDEKIVGQDNMECLVRDLR